MTQADASPTAAAASWSAARAPGADVFAALAEAAVASIPEPLRGYLGDIAFRVAEFPDEDVIRDLDLDSPFDILGLYQGISLAEKSNFDSGALPDTITLYRRPILDVWAEGEETLGDLITHVLIHEVGHHFGLSDADMEALEAAADG
ncbi:putative Zn-dependent protease with MMP-like domain [Rhodothalassium salexigens DSM 2132]|uniref:Putative Zn-dependent protease with MMP-like domain n=1 Tax=Rhodothalassium salexigens DSM 2132 TaxID=1188247 RepID=A0A4R2PA07_RHOSA|nr:metallopeptidase family protein [Rhodothalassium salexigens]MBB4212529.1 putative Zn-dependent protease with MMP-like domain [Rhodothalassium salexigens DSM 2132]MBK1639662.1 Zn-dependent protease [Rhodothalassium salexigens DSM 2132]TCP31074.1 putative Zn-dependent protease with MMP-like domain [Rhodothalassium salexigens DSM 2132]